MSKTFDIIVFEEDELADGSLGMKQHPENGVKANSWKELVGMYAMCGQKIQKVREYEEVENNNTMNSIPNNMSIQQNKNNTMVLQSNAQTNKIQQQNVSIPTKYFNVAGVDCKLDNGKLYQKQWVRLNENETKNYRLINDANNKNISIIGKHLEMLKWIIIEDPEENIDNKENN